MFDDMCTVTETDIFIVPGVGTRVADPGQDRDVSRLVTTGTFSQTLLEHYIIDQAPANYS